MLNNFFTEKGEQGEHSDGFPETTYPEKCSQPSPSTHSDYRLGVIYRELVKFYKDYIEFPDEEAYSLIAIWTLGTYMYDSFRSYPYIYLMGVKAGGKSKVLTLTSVLSKDPLFASSISTAALFRSIEKTQPTLLIDELESLSKERMEEIRLIIQAGYKRSGKAIRCVGKDFETKAFNVYCPKMFASIKVPTDVFESRCIPIIMRRTLNRKIANKEVDDENEFWNGYRNAMRDTVENNKYKILDVYGNIEDDVLIGRDWELWKPILSLAKFISDDVYDQLRNYAISLSKQRSEDDSDEIKNTIVRLLLELVKEDGWFGNKDIFPKLKNEFDWITPQRLGYQMKTLGFKSKSYNKGKRYFLKISEILDVAKRLGVSTEEEHVCEMCGEAAAKQVSYKEVDDLGKTLSEKMIWACKKHCYDSDEKGLERWLDGKKNVED